MNDHNPTFGSKTDEYPHGYGYCQCGCGRKTSKLNDGTLASYVSRHHPFARERAEKNRSAKNKSPRKALLQDTTSIKYPSLYSFRHDTAGKSIRSLTFSRLAVEILKTENKQIKTKNFRKEIRKFLDKSLRDEFRNDKELAEDLGSDRNDFNEDEYIKHSIQDLMSRLNFVPDAYYINESEKVIYIYEVEDAHPLTIEKLESLAYSWLYFDEAGFKFRVFVVDRYCHDRKELDLDIYEELLVQHRHGKLDKNK